MNYTKLKRLQARRNRQTAMKKSLRQYKNRCLSDYGITAQQAEPQQDTTNDLKVIFKHIQNYSVPHHVSSLMSSFMVFSFGMQERNFVPHT